MPISRHTPREAVGTTFKTALAAALDEALMAIEEALTGLTDEQAWARPLKTRNSIGAIAMHVQDNLDTYACHFQTGRPALVRDDRFDLWRLPDGVLADQQGDVPTVATMLQRLRDLRAEVERGLETATNDSLLGPRSAEAWWREGDRNAADAYVRTILHTASHVRQIWLLRGLLGLTDADGWPEQRWA